MLALLHCSENSWTRTSGSFGSVYNQQCNKFARSSEEDVQSPFLKKSRMNFNCDFNSVLTLGRFWPVLLPVSRVAEPPIWEGPGVAKRLKHTGQTGPPIEPHGLLDAADTPLKSDLTVSWQRETVFSSFPTYNVCADWIKHPHPGEDHSKGQSVAHPQRPHSNLKDGKRNSFKTHKSQQKHICCSSFQPSDIFLCSLQNSTWNKTIQSYFRKMSDPLDGAVTFDLPPVQNILLYFSFWLSPEGPSLFSSVSFQTLLQDFNWPLTCPSL